MWVRDPQVAPLGDNWRLGLHSSWYPYSRDWRLRIHFPRWLRAEIEARTAFPMRPCGRDWRVGLRLPWCPTVGIKGWKYTSHGAAIEARDKFLIMFYIRPCDQDLIINGSQVFVQGSQLQEIKSVWADSSKKRQHYWKFRIQARARSLGCARDKKQNWKAGRNQCCLPFAKSASLCHSLLLWVCGFLHGLGFHLTFVSSQTTSGLKHSSQTCPWNVKYQELPCLVILFWWTDSSLSSLVESSLGQDAADNLLCYSQGSLYQSHDIQLCTLKQASATQAVLMVGNPLRQSGENHLYERDLITRMGEQLKKKTTT